MRYCKKCLMPDTRPGITFNEEGVCCACINHARKKEIDWNARYKELEKLCDKYRGCNGPGAYDCMIAVSGGKDSHYQVHVMKELMGMNPLLVSVEDNFTMTEAGKSNIRNISEAFGCQIISLKPDIKTQKTLMRKTFEKYGKPTWFIDRLIYTFPLYMALKLNLKLLVYGENVSYEYGGTDSEESYSARNILLNGVASDIDINELLGDGVTEKELFFTQALSKKDLENIDPIYLSYFVPWNSITNYEYAKSVGFKDLSNEWDRTHHAENYDQIDSYAYLVHPWLKYPKFGHASATDYCSRFIRYGVMTREEAKEIVRKRDHNLDQRSVEDFCKFCGYTRREFWNIIDGFYNRKLFKKDEYGKWVLINNDFE